MYAIHAYIDPPNLPNVGIYIYMVYMECLGFGAWMFVSFGRRCLPPGAGGRAWKLRKS